MALKEKLDGLLNTKKLEKFVNEWKEGKGKKIRDSYLFIAGLAHNELHKKIEEWMKNESNMGENFHETFDKELLNPVKIEIKIEIDGETYENAWKSVLKGEISKADLDEKQKRGAEMKVSGNPAWSLSMAVFKPAESRSEDVEISEKSPNEVKDEGGEPLRKLPNKVKDEIAKEVLKILVENAEKKSENYGEISKAIKDKIREILQENIDLLKASGMESVVEEIGKSGHSRFGPSVISSILHAIDPSFYIHIDNTLSQAFKISDENFPDIHKRANELMEKYGLQNLCDVYWLFKAIEDEVIDITDGNDYPTLNGYFESKGFHFTDEQIFAFYNALKTKGFLILAGLSGTGKTKIAQLFADLLGKEKEDDNNKFLCFLSVRPDWRDSTSLLGYYNPITEKYQSTPLLKFILQASNDLQNPYFLILDEMNLAHVEYYFADFLSVLESGRGHDGFTNEEIQLHSKGETVKDEEGNDIPEKIKLPPNLFIIGTVNIDETTYMFSPKVLDRAFTIEFRDVDLASYIEKLTKEEETKGEEEKQNGNEGEKGEGKSLKEKILDDIRNGGKFYAFDKKDIKNALKELEDFKNELEKLNDALLPYDLGFGYRVVDEIALFIDLAKQSKDFLPHFGAENEMIQKAKDLAVLMKVLPKFHGPKAKLEKPLVEVLKWSSNKTIDKSKQIEDVLKELFNDKWNNLRSVLMEWNSQTQTFKYPLTAKKVTEMLARLYEIGFTSFM
jgi:MoxR-like ATPase